MYCSASEFEGGCLTPKEQSGMPDLGWEEDSERKKRNGQNNLSVFWSLILNKEFPVPVWGHAINRCKMSAWICQWLEAKALRRAWEYQQWQSVPLVNYFTVNQNVPGKGCSLLSTVQICLLTYPICIQWPPLWIQDGFWRAWRKPHCKFNPFFLLLFLGNLST